MSIVTVWTFTDSVSSSYVEGIVRGYRNTLLTNQHYNNLTQCETIDGPSPAHRKDHLMLT